MRRAPLIRAPLIRAPRARDRRWDRAGRGGPRLAGPSHESATFNCRTAAPLELTIHPILYRDVPHGSALGIADRRTKRLLAAVNFFREPQEDRVWARAYWDEDVCVVRR